MTTPSSSLLLEDASSAPPLAPQLPPSSSQALYVAPDFPQRVFASWAAFDASVARWARESFQLFRKRTSTSVQLRNRRLLQRSDASNSKPRPRPIPEHYGSYAVTLVCTHSGSFSSRGSGQRARPRGVRARRCDAQINACLKLADAAGDGYKVVVTRAALQHNHPLDKETFERYASSRLSLSSGLLECVELMRRAGVKPRDIRAYIVDHSGCEPTLKDVQNILARLRMQAQQRGDHQAQQQPQEAMISKRTSDDNQSVAALQVQEAEEDPGPVFGTAAQFQMADAMGRRVAHTLASLPSAQFSDALRVLELAETIVRERQLRGQHIA